MFNTKFSVWAALALVFTLACGGSNKVLISPSDIQNAQSSGTLSELLHKTKGLLGKADGDDKSKLLKTQSEIIRLLVSQKSEKIDLVLSNKVHPMEVVRRTEILAAQREIAVVKDWSANDYIVLNNRLVEAINQGNQLISELNNKASQQANPIEALLIFRQAADVAGAGEPEDLFYQNHYQALMDSFIEKGSDALSKRMFAEAKSIAEQGLKISENNFQFDSMLAQAEAGLFDKEFSQALANGKPEIAYQLFEAVSDQPIFGQLSQSMQKSILLLADYFASSAEQAASKGQLKAAYLGFNRGREIQTRLGVSQPGFVQEKKFVEQLIRNSREQKLGLAERLAFALAAKEFDPAYPKLDEEINKLNADIRQRALTKLSVQAFKEVAVNDPTIASFGRRVSSKIEKLLFDQLKNDVSILANESLEKNSADLLFHGAVLVIEGEVLQAVIETSSNQGTRSVNVQTSLHRTETEEYLDWSKRKRGDAPQRYLETPLFEDVNLNIEHIQKQAIAEVSFKIVEPASGKIMLTDSLVAEANFSGETINEYLRGDFHQPYVKADLPSDIKIMEQLSANLAERLGSQLTQYLGQPENHFYQQYLTAKEQNQLKESVEFIGNALVIASDKAKNTAEWVKNLTDLVIQ